MGGMGPKGGENEENWKWPYVGSKGTGVSQSLVRPGPPRGTRGEGTKGEAETVNFSPSFGDRPTGVADVATAGGDGSTGRDEGVAEALAGVFCGVGQASGAGDDGVSASMAMDPNKVASVEV